MNTLRCGKWYPLTDGPTIKTKPNLFGRSYEFKVTAYALWPKERIRVYGRTTEGVWCTRTYKFKHVPNWLNRGIKNGNVSAKV